MNWEWVVPVIVLVVWILTHVIRPAEEAPPREAPRPPGDGEAPPQPVSEVDRFLEEINRMRRKAAEEQGRGVATAEERPRSRPVPTRPPRRLEDIPTVEPAREPAPRRAPATVPLSDIPLALPATPAPAPPPPPSAPAPPTRPSPAFNVPALLRSPNAVRTAIVLQEVLGPPRSRRPLRRQGTAPRSLLS